MMIRRAIAGSVAALFLVSGTALADYQPSQDVTLSATAAPSLLQTSGTTGDLSFSVQEALHQTVTDLTGISADHYYTWVYVNGQPVLAVDPLAVGSVR